MIEFWHWVLHWFPPMHSARTALRKKSKKKWRFVCRRGYFGRGSRWVWVIDGKEQSTDVIHKTQDYRPEEEQEEERLQKEARRQLTSEAPVEIPPLPKKQRRLPPRRRPRTTLKPVPLVTKRS